ncbi:hypothetical protein B0A52_00193 [Exophiala mesophila]|uniref:Uncharacterized protein n=1 Tax=Exophiala mesophila TaxID=212818 RepID=A0A438NJC3_EXOME|nr:hypothetical protein B0A52_00193 [Exophiala mesophila]
MAYASLAQQEHELDAHSPEPLETTSQLNSPAFDRLQDHDGPNSLDQGPPVSSILQSLGSSQSYEMVEDDDYEDHMATPMGLALDVQAPSYPLPRDDVECQPSDSPPMRTASISRNLPLKHPTPDLHAIQGALAKNVERLEESAERLSMTSSLEEELQKMKQDQRRIERQSSAPVTSDRPIRPSVQRQFSTGSWSNSIIGINQTARHGGYSPSGYITSPTGSISNPHSLDRHSSKGSRREHSLPEPLLEGRPLDFASIARAPVSIIPDQGVTVASPDALDNQNVNERPATSASNETYRQAEFAFNDFDGVHFDLPSSRTNSFSRRISLKHPPLAKDAKAYREVQPGERMIYYPAPVPVMLNLPQRLSKANLGEKERRRLQGISGIPADLRKSAAWLKDQDPAKLHGSKESLSLPPQLRASAFFEQPSITQNLELKNGSAVQTLDSILDAAAYAPVSAFTDHPIAGQLGKEVYGPDSRPRKSVQLPNDQTKKRRNSMGNLLKVKRSSSATMLTRTKSRDSKVLLEGDDFASGDELDRVTAKAMAPDADEMASDHDSDDQGQNFNAPPTTLLAELQMRKEQQKLRNRTAANAFPTGMHSTLLELDAVTQLQQKARKTKHVTLAWEDHEEADKQNYDDEDVPLGMLFPEKDRAEHFNAHRPVGLLERREREDNEPLSHRRARLRGEPLPAADADTKSQHETVSRPPVIEDVPGLSQPPLPEQEDETLAQRAARIKLEKANGSGGQFAAELTSQLGLDVDKGKPSAPTPDPEETLGQRRRRLKEEALRNGGGSTSKPQLSSMHSLADILQSHPVGVQAGHASNMSYGAPVLDTNPMRQSSMFMNQPYGYYSSANFPYMRNGYNASMPAMYAAPLPMYMQNQIAAYQPGFSQPYIQDPMSGPPLDSKQRAKIDQWRQSVV